MPQESPPYRNDTAFVAEMLREHIGLVHLVVGKYSWAQKETEEMVAEGRLGLVEAALRFDTTRGFRFGTYAVHYIRAYILGVVQDRGFTRGVNQTLSVVAVVSERMARELGREPTDQEVSERLGWNVGRVSELRIRASLRDVRFDATISRRTGASETLAEIIPDTAPGPHERYEEGERARQCRQVVMETIARLPEREQTILRMRYLADEPATLKQVGKAIGVTHERVRQLEVNVMKKLRAFAKRIMKEKYNEQR